jgi:cytochrome c peroxidase
MNKIIISLLIFSATIAYSSSEFSFTDSDRTFLGNLALSNVEPPKGDRGNEHLQNEAVALLGKKLFYDKRLSGNGKVACSTCHSPNLYFTDGRPQSIGISKTKMNSPSILLSKWSPWQFWNGRKDSLWSQALGPLESPEEHGFSRLAVAKVIVTEYSEEYKIAFKTSEEPKDISDVNLIFSNVGKAIMAFEHRLELKPSRFDNFVKQILAKNDQAARKLFSNAEFSGLKVFTGKGNCISCHNGPLLTNFEFHNVGIPEFDKAKVDMGRHDGVKQLKIDEFTCLSEYSTAKASECKEMRFLKTSGPELVGAFKTPSLRNVAITAPYMHSGQFATLEDVVNHYNKPKPPFFDRKQHPSRPHFDILPLQLSDEEKTNLVAFLKTLTSPIPKGDKWWDPI